MIKEAYEAGEYAAFEKVSVSRDWIYKKVAGGLSSRQKSALGELFPHVTPKTTPAKVSGQAGKAPWKRDPEMLDRVRDINTQTHPNYASATDVDSVASKVLKDVPKALKTWEYK